jgi:2-polyprenyl-6-methoxyphenol hydroxylase-like FAD-dependent oxidoreductase
MARVCIAGGDAKLTSGSKQERRSRYLKQLGRFPEVIEPRVLDGAEMISDVVAAPESLMRGFFRAPNGPGVALVGDACHFKHPGTAQVIVDAVEQAVYVAEALCGPKPSLDGYEVWRDQRACEHYEWSFAWGRFPREETEHVSADGRAREMQRRICATRSVAAWSRLRS